MNKFTEEFIKLASSITDEECKYYKAMPYDQFLESDYWKIVRDQVKNRDENFCQLCKSKSVLRVHHKSYKNHGLEHLHLDDLVTLCKMCHNLQHPDKQKPQTIVNAERKTFKRKRSGDALADVTNELIRIDNKSRLLPKRKRSRLEYGRYNFAAILMCADILGVKISVNVVA